MLHFNELYVTEDSRHLIIDVEIDDGDNYDACYLKSIEIGLGNNCDNSGSFGELIPVWQTDIIGDLDGDHEITEADEALYQEMYSQISEAIMNHSVQDYPFYKNLDVDFDEEITVSDLNALQRIYADNLYIPIKERHKRLCLNAGKLSALGLLPSDRLGGLFIVRVAAGCDIDVLVDTDCGCDASVITGVAYNGKPLYDTAVKYADAYGNTCSSNDLMPFMDWLLRYYGFLFALKNGDICQAQYYWSNFLNGTAKSVARSSNPCGCHGTYR